MGIVLPLPCSLLCSHPAPELGCSFRNYAEIGVKRSPLSDIGAANCWRKPSIITILVKPAGNCGISYRCGGCSISSERQISGIWSLWRYSVALMDL